MATLSTNLPAIERLVADTRQSMGSQRPGFHVSGVISHIETALRMKPLTRMEGDYLFAIVGLAWETWVRHKLGDGDYVWQFPVELDGVVGTIDGLDVSEHQPVVIECKATWASSERDVRDVWRYMSQVKAYSYMAGGADVDMYMLYLQRPPQIAVYRLQFTEQELMENWTMLINARESMMS